MIVQQQQQQQQQQQLLVIISHLANFKSEGRSTKPETKKKRSNRQN